MPKYRKVLIKLSGEALLPTGATRDSILSVEIINRYARAIKQVVALGVEVSVVVGGGNIWRGKHAEEMGMERATADYMGMLGTIINALALQNVFEQHGLETRVQTALPVNSVAEPYIRRRALRHLEKGRVMIFGGGTGSPYFSTDTTAALRAAEMEADCILMAKSGVDGVYNADPKKNSNATMYKRLTFMDILKDELQVMDSTAVSLCMDNNIDLIVFNMNDETNLVRIVEGADIGTHISKELK